MAINLSAEQKNIESMFCTTTEQYIVPQYQRPYSWTFDQCADLFRDLKTAFDDKDPYFLGNVILARSKDFDMTGQNYIVDGQQRLITIWMFIKVLSVLLENVNTLRSALTIVPWTGEANEPKIKSLIFENKDDDAIREISTYSKDKIKSRYAEVTSKSSTLKEDNCKNPFEANLLYFYEQIKYSGLEDDELKLTQFAQYLMKRVSLLPIVQTADNEEDANDKALTIFETINNRGLDLEDADIFKARLYNSAYTDIQRQDFISQWVDFKSVCDGLKMSIDDVFRYYSHVIRGREGITTSEKRLRDFFTNDSQSPLSCSSYEAVLTDLNKILDSIKYVRRVAGKGDVNEPGPWIQIINEYTNQYPMYAVVVYLFNHRVDTKDEIKAFVTFLQSLIRCCLYVGSTSSVKFGIYPIIKQVSNGNSIDQYRRSDIDTETFNHLGRLKNAYALLSYVLDTGNEIPKKYNIDKIINLRDEDLLDSGWVYDNLNDICNSVGNLVVLDIPKRYISYKDKFKYYKTSSNEYVSSIFQVSGFEYGDWKMRNIHMKNLLVKFFSKEINDQSNN